MTATLREMVATALARECVRLDAKVPVAKMKDVSHLYKGSLNDNERALTTGAVVGAAKFGEHVANKVSGKVWVKDPSAKGGGY